MGVAHIADDFSAHHAMRAVNYLTHIFGIDGLEVAGPAATGIELGIRLEQRRIAANAGVDAVFMVIPKAPGEGALGCRMTRHLVLLRGEHGAPFLIGFGNFVSHDEQLTSKELAQSGGRAA